MDSQDRSVGKVFLNRLLFDILIVLSLLWFPWPVTVILSLGALVAFGWYLEIILWALILDIVYGVSGGFYFTIFALVFYILITAFKKKLRYNL